MLLFLSSELDRTIQKDLSVTGFKENEQESKMENGKWLFKLVLTRGKIKSLDKKKKTCTICSQKMERKERIKSLDWFWVRSSDLLCGVELNFLKVSIFSSSHLVVVVWVCLDIFTFHLWWYEKIFCIINNERRRKCLSWKRSDLSRKEVGANVQGNERTSASLARRRL